MAAIKPEMIISAPILERNVIAMAIPRTYRSSYPTELVAMMYR